MAHYYDERELRNTPSILDNIDYETEIRYRKEGALLIRDIAVQMDLDCNTKATGIVYFHRFYMFYSFRLFPPFAIACSCLSLAYEVEEAIIKHRDIINTARSLLNDVQFSTLSENPMKAIVILEKIVVETIIFDLEVEHPYQYLLYYAKYLKGDASKLEKLVQTAWTFINDSLCTTLSLQWKPEIIAVALLYLAGRHTKFELVDWIGRTKKHLRWWDMFVEDITMDLLEDICNQVLDLYPGRQIYELQPDGPSPSAKPAIVATSSSEKTNGHEKVKVETPQAKSLTSTIPPVVLETPPCPLYSAFPADSRPLSPDSPASGCLYPNVLHVAPHGETNLPSSSNFTITPQ